MGGVAGFEHLAGEARRDDPVDLPQGHGFPGREVERRQVVLGDVTNLVERLTMGKDEIGAPLTEVRQPHPSVDVLAQVHHLAVGGRLGNGDRADLLNPPGGGRWRRSQAIEAMIGDRNRLPLLWLAVVVLGLAGH